MNEHYKPWGNAVKDDQKSIARKMYQAYVDKNRAAIEEILSADFHFTSPLDNRLNRAVYFDRCWKNSETTKEFRFVNLVSEGDHVLVTYEGQDISGKRFRNTELISFRDGKIVDVEVYFGWSIPHEAPEGGFINSQG